MSSDANQLRAFKQALHKERHATSAQQTVGVKGQQAQSLNDVVAEAMNEHVSDGVSNTDAHTWKRVERETRDILAKELGKDASSAQVQRAAKRYVQGAQEALQKNASARSSRSARVSPVAARSTSSASLSAVNERARALSQDAAPVVRGQKLSYTSGRGPRGA